VATHDYVISNGTGSAVRSDLNGALAAIVSQNSNASEPATMYAYQWWADTTTGLLKIRNAANSAWVTIGTLASANLGLLPLAGGTMTGVLAVTAGTAALPGIAVSGDTNTGIYSPGADQLAISTGGTARITVDGSGNVNIDSGTFYVDAANNRIGLGTTGPTAPLHLVSASSDPVLIKTTGSSLYNSLILENDTGSKVAVGIGGSTVGGSVQDAGYVGTISNKPFYINTNNTQRVAVTAAGLVGIGTTAPLASIEITGSSECMRIQSTTAANNYITHKHNSSGDIAYIGAAGGGALTSGANTDYAIRANQGALLFGTNGNNERGRFDSSGRFLVGTSTALNVEPFVASQVQTEARYGYANIYRANDVNGPTAYFIKSRASGAATVVQSGDVLGQIRFQGADGNNYEAAAASIRAEVDATPGTNDMPGRLVFSTTADGAASPTERMRIGNGGSTSLFSSNNIGLDVSSSLAAGTTDYVLRGRYGASGNTGGTTSFQVFTNGNVQNTNNSYGAISDIKLKENIVDANSQWDDLKALQVRNYNFKEGQTHTQIGLVAQEVELVSPGLVNESPDRDEEGNDLGTVTKSVNYSVLYMKAVKALQEAMERIEALEADVAALKGA